MSKVSGLKLRKLANFIFAIAVYTRSVTLLPHRKNDPTEDGASQLFLGIVRVAEYFDIAALVITTYVPNPIPVAGPSR